MNVSYVFTDTIRVPDGHRRIDLGVVEELAHSFQLHGQQNPISFYYDGDTPVLIAGRHRLEAARSLNWDMIDAVEIDAHPLKRELWQIDENLIRAELTEMERGEHFKRRSEIFKEMKKINEENFPISPKPRGRPKGFDQDTADKTGMDKSAVRKSRRRAEKITPEVKDQIKDMPVADKGVELDALASLEPDEQAQAVERVKSGASTDFREAKNFIKGDEPSPSALEFERLKKAWQKAGGEAREQFLAWINREYETAAGQ